MALDGWMYRDPLEVAMRKESMTCKGCKHQQITRAFGVDIATCKKRKKHGTRCREYKEKS